MLRKIYYWLSPSQRLLARRLVYFPIDLFERITGKRPPLVPPRSMVYTGTGDYLKGGRLYLSFFKKYGQLEPHHRVLDVGSGIGRMALPLTSYLSQEGSYEGFDIVESGVKWCRKHITSRYPSFRFTHVHLQNDLYSSSGQQASEFKFPHTDQEFDFVFLTSVFTHMIPEEVENYMQEISRVLKKGGKCFATFFVFGQDIPEATADNSFRFNVHKGHYMLMDARVKSANVAYEMDFITNQLAKPNQLQIKTFVQGYWRGTQAREDIDFQDIIVFEKL